MKICTKCKLPKVEEEFAWKKRGIRRHSNCRECQRLMKQSHYQSNKGTYAARNVRYKEETRQLIRTLKSKPCVDCKRNYPWPCMQFDHVASDKSENVSTLAGHGAKLKALAEAGKCEIVCANCHALRTATRAGVWSGVSDSN